MELKAGDIVWLKPDQNQQFTIGSIFKNMQGDSVAAVYWYCRLTGEIKTFEIPVEALTS